MENKQSNLAIFHENSLKTSEAFFGMKTNPKP